MLRRVNLTVYLNDEIESENQILEQIDAQKGRVRQEYLRRLLTTGAERIDGGVDPSRIRPRKTQSASRAPGRNSPKLDKPKATFSDADFPNRMDTPSSGQSNYVELNHAAQTPSEDGKRPSTEPEDSTEHGDFYAGIFN